MGRSYAVNPHVGLEEENVAPVVIWRKLLLSFGRIVIFVATLIFEIGTCAAFTVETHNWGTNTGITPVGVPGEKQVSGSVKEYRDGSYTWTTTAEKHGLILREGQEAKISISGLVRSPSSAALYVAIISNDKMLSFNQYPITHRLKDIAVRSFSITGSTSFSITAGASYPSSTAQTGIGRNYLLHDGATTPFSSRDELIYIVLSTSGSGNNETIGYTLRCEVSNINSSGDSGGSGVGGGSSTDSRWSFSKLEDNFSADGGTGFFTVTCQKSYWSLPQNGITFIRFLPDSWSLNGDLSEWVDVSISSVDESTVKFSYNVAPNVGNRRTGTMTIRFRDLVQSFSITQSAQTSVTTYTVTYEPGSYSSGGSTYTAQKPSNVALTLRNSTYSRTGYTQTAWSKSSTGTSRDYELGASYTANADIMLYPYWTANTYTVTFDKQGGSGGTSSKTVTYGSAMPSITLPTCDGYSFGGYYTENGTQYYTSSGASARNWNLTSDTTLYAKWTANPRPDNDDFAAAKQISGASGTLTGSNVGATMQSSEPMPKAQPNSKCSVWYKWTAPSSGTVTFDTIGSSFDTVLGLYTGTSVSTLTEIDSSDDIESGSIKSRVTFTATSGTTYRIAVYGCGANGAFTLNWSLTSGGGSSGNTKYALCVGLNDYDMTSWHSEGWSLSVLNGCVNDATYFRNNLVNRGGWSSANVTKLTDSGATKTAIRKAITNYAAKAVSGDTFIFQHSSHGLSDPDTSGNYTKDVALAAYAGPYWDFELASDLGKFASGVKVVVVVDTCHSGGLFKGMEKIDANGLSFDIASRVSALIDNQRDNEAKSGNKAATKGILSSEIGWATAAEYDKVSSDGACYDSMAWMTDWSKNWVNCGGDVCGGAFTAALTWGWWTGTADANGNGAMDVYEGFSYAETVLANIGKNPPKCLNEGVLRSVALGANGGYPTSPDLAINDYAANGNTSSITLSWSGAQNATSYNVYRSTSASPRPSTPHKIGVTSPYTDSASLIQGRRYYYWIEAKNSSGSAFSAPDWGNTIIPLATVLDNSTLSFTTGGDASWWGQSDVSHAGADSARTGMIGNSKDSWLQTTVSGAGTLAFWWKSSCEDDNGWYDYLEVLVDGTQKQRIKGETDWTQVSLSITGSGNHTIKWNYHKDDTNYDGSDCGWVDQVTWTASTSATRPVNDNFADATLISGASGSISGSNVGATYETGEPLKNYKAAATNTIWWVWTAPLSGVATFCTTNTTFDTVMGVYTGSSVSSLKTIKQDDDGGPNHTSICAFDAVPGTTYYIAVSGYGASKQGAIKLDWNVLPLQTYTISYKPGPYASGLTYTATKTNNISMVLRNSTYSRTGYTQGAWSTNSTGTSRNYEFSAAYTANASLTLYPYWTTNTYGVSYALNDGTHGVTHPTSATYDTAFYVSAPKRNGYTFTGWTVTNGLNTSTAKWGTTSSPSTSLTSSTKCVNGATGAVYFKNLTPTANGSVTLTANWQCNHTSTTVQNAREATCTAAGYTGDMVCITCGATIATGSTIPTLGHQEGEGVVTKEPTATEEGVVTYSCTRCGIVMRTEAIPKVGPVWTIENGVLIAVELNGFTDVVIPDTVKSIGACVFYNLSSSARNGLKSVVIPNSVTNIAEGAFACCSGLTNVTMSSGMTCIGDWAFQNCECITDILIPDSVTEIGKGAFLRCYGLACITIPSNVANVAEYTFCDCRSLTSVDIPASITHIGASAFEGCNGLARVNISDIAAWCRIVFEYTVSEDDWDEEYWYLASNPISFAHNLYLDGQLVDNLV